MIHQAFIAPTEKPPTSLEIKRALLTYDKIFISDPSDRDLIPPQSYMTAAFPGMPSLMGFNSGPVRTLGKTENYDASFDQLLEEVKYAHHSDLLEVISSYDLSSSNQATLGAVITGDYPLNPPFVLWSYRNLARNNEALLSAISSDKDLFHQADEYIFSITNAGVQGADCQINDDPLMPLIDGPLQRDHLREAYSNIARQRIGAVIKSVGFCAAKSMVPIFSELSYNLISQNIISRANSFIDKISEFDPYWSSRSRALKIAHEEYIDDAMLDKIPLDEVIKLRTKAWGKQAEARDSLLHSVAELTRQAEKAENFEDHIRKQIQEYKKNYQEVQQERGSLNFKIKCDVTKGLAGGIAGVDLIPGLLSQVQQGVGVAGLILAGCMWAIDKLEDYKAASETLKAAESELKDDACIGMHNFYTRLN